MDGLNEEQKERLDEFIREAFYLTEDEYAALDGVRPMDYEMYKQLERRLTEIGCCEHFFQLLQRYPSFLEKETEEIEKELMFDYDDEERIQESKANVWQRLCKQIKEETGDDLMTNNYLQ